MLIRGIDSLRCAYSTKLGSGEKSCTWDDCSGVLNRSPNSSGANAMKLYDCAGNYLYIYPQDVDDIPPVWICSTLRLCDTEKRG